MNGFLALVAASLLSRLSYQMARSPVLPRFALAAIVVAGAIAFVVLVRDLATPRGAQTST